MFWHHLQFHSIHFLLLLKSLSVPSALRGKMYRDAKGRYASRDLSQCCERLLYHAHTLVSYLEAPARDKDKA